MNFAMRRHKLPRLPLVSTQQSHHRGTVRRPEQCCGGVTVLPCHGFYGSRSVSITHLSGME
jgi:hypothetical protein